MRVVIQRVSQASVTVDGNITGSIGNGLLVLAGFEEADGEEDHAWMASKIMNLRIFNDEAGVMNLSLQETGGNILVVSQFTLHASTKKGNRPSYIKAAKPAEAKLKYENFLSVLGNATGRKIEAGIFGADMKVSLVNDGPVTIIIDSRNKE
jgi:D-tyrosyl-tRNA(Tyr) deacylase